MTAFTADSGEKIFRDQSDETRMAGTGTQPAGSTSSPATTYNNPRRTSPENSITLRHHRMAREVSKRNALKMGVTSIPKVSITGSPRRNSSDESNETGTSDPRRWFDKANQSIHSTLDSSMDVDPPFFHKETASSVGEGYMMPTQSPAYRYVQSRDAGLLQPGVTHSSSADDYRSVIDDLTIENKRLKDELKRYKQKGPDSLKRDKLFEVKVHGLPSRKKRELEAALRDFTTSLDGSSTGVSASGRKEKSKDHKVVDTTLSKHASSSSGSNTRPNPTDSAYASMSNGTSSSNQSLPNSLSRQQSDNTERQILDVPEGLLPKFSVLTEKERKKLVVRRLEQLFTGKSIGHTRHNSLSLIPPVISEDVEMSGANAGETLPAPMAQNSREAHILPRSRATEAHYRDMDNISPSNSNDDHIDSRKNGSDSRSGSRSARDEDDPSRLTVLPEQRPTRPNDLDPDRPSVPSDNMEYIRHLGLAVPEARKYSSRNVSSDAEGWVYLNLLCSMAQLHMFNVTPAFIRSAVSEKSRQFQLSPDGRKIRWRGGAEGTRFSSDSSGTASRGGSSSPETDGSNEQDQRKKQKIQGSQNNGTVSEPAKFGPQVSSSSDEIHYKPMFVHHQTSSGDELQSFMDETGSSSGLREETNLGMLSRWNQSGEAGALQRKRRRDGAIIYYTGAPFCTDLSGDCREYSNPTNPSDMTVAELKTPSGLRRTVSGSSIPFKPLSTYDSHRAMMDLDSAPQGSIFDVMGESDEIQADFPWSKSEQTAKLANLEASGIGGIAPDDHFVVVVSTKRPKAAGDDGSFLRPSFSKMDSQETATSKDTAESLVGRLATMSTTSPLPLSPSVSKANKVEIGYLTGQVRRLPPTPLPPPSFFFASASSSFETTSSDSESEYDGVISRRLLLRPGQTYSPNEELSSNDEEDEHCDDEGDADESGSIESDQGVEMAGIVLCGVGRGASTKVSGTSRAATRSSVATAGGAVSDHSSMGDS